MLTFILLQRLPDGGGFYAETNPEHWIMEPWNAYSSLTFWIPVFYFLYKLRGKYHEYPFLMLCMPLLFLGGLGSALFHAFRKYPLFLALDVLPIMLLNMALVIYFWKKLLRHWIYTVLLIGAFLGFQIGLLKLFPIQLSINVNYFLRGVMIFLPTLLIAKKMNFEKFHYLVLTIGFFILALTFRYLDKTVADFLPMGSHFLWHCSTSIGAFFLAEFLIVYADFEMREKTLELSVSKH